jgi:hypothetical protein
MSNTNFVVGTGLSVGSTTITASTGDIATSSNITIGNTAINGVSGTITIGNTTINGTTGAISTTAPITTANLTVGGQTVQTLATVTSTGSYNDLIDKPAEFSRVATTSVTGLVQVGGNLSVNGSGVLSLSSANVTAALGFTPVNSSTVGQANGVASLNSSGKVPLTQIDSSLIGALNYQGTWNANTNSPAIIPSTGTKGYYYTVSVAGTTTIDGNNNWTVGDIIAFNGSVWNQIQGAASDVISVAGQTGVVTLTKSDVGLGNVTNVAQLASTQTLTLTGDVTASATALSTGTIATTVGTLTNKSLTNPTITNYVETLYAPSAGSSFTVDLANGTFQKFTTNGNTTITLPSSVAGKSYTLLIAYGGTHTISFSGGSTIKWSGGTAPTATSVNGKFDIYVFTCDGTNTYGRSGGTNF